VSAAWQPLALSRGAWQAIRDEILASAGRGALSDAWTSDLTRADGETVTVFLTPALAGELAALLDEHPRLQALLAG
jgi:hypothetical protein